MTRPTVHCNSGAGGPLSRCELEVGGGLENWLERPDFFFCPASVHNRFLQHGGGEPDLPKF